MAGSSDKMSERDENARFINDERHAGDFDARISPPTRRRKKQPPEPTPEPEAPEPPKKRSNLVFLIKDDAA